MADKHSSEPPVSSGPSASSSSKRHVFVAGVMAGLFSRFVIAPLDVVKIRLQLQPHGHDQFHPHSPTYRGILPTMRTIIVQEGIHGLWKGNVPAEMLYMAYGAAQFLAYREATVALKKLPYELPDSAVSFVAGAASGGAATIVTYPLDLLRTRFAAQGDVKIYNSLYHSVGNIYKDEGIKGFFRGMNAAVAQIVPYMAIFFCVYELGRHTLEQHPLISSDSANAVSGATASVIGKTAIFPLDLIRKRLQVQGPTRQQYVHRNIPVYAGVAGAARSIMQTEGLRGLYKGLAVSLVKAAPLSALTMWSFERSLKILEKWDPEG